MQTNFKDNKLKEQQTLYHMSSVKFDKPDLNKIDVVKENECEKRVLGLWCTDKPNLEGFGDYCYEVVMKNESIVKSLDLAQLFKIHQKLQTHDNILEEYKKIREVWKKEADIVYLIDNCPGVGEVIIVNFDKILSFSLVSVKNKVVDKRKLSM